MDDEFLGEIIEGEFLEEFTEEGEVLEEIIEEEEFLEEISEEGEVLEEITEEEEPDFASASANYQRRPDRNLPLQKRHGKGRSSLRNRGFEVIVKDIPAGMDEKRVRSHFEAAGEILNLNMAGPNIFITYRTLREAKRAVESKRDYNVVLKTEGTTGAEQPTTSAGSASPSLGKGISVDSGRPPWVDIAMSVRPKIPHSFQVHTYTKPTMCHLCKKLLKGFCKQGVQCKDCHFNAHQKCAERMPPDCTGQVPKEPADIAMDDDDLANDPFDDGSDNEGMDIHEPSSKTQDELEFMDNEGTKAVKRKMEALIDKDEGEGSARYRKTMEDDEEEAVFPEPEDEKEDEDGDLTDLTDEDGELTDVKDKDDKDDEDDENENQQENKKDEDLSTEEPAKPQKAKPKAKPQKATVVRGSLLRKRVWDSETKRASDRSWERLFVVIKKSTMSLYENARSSQNNEAAKETMEVFGAIAEKERNYVKKNFVFKVRLVCGREVWFQASDKIEMESWIEDVRRHAA